MRAVTKESIPVKLDEVLSRLSEGTSEGEDDELSLANWIN